MRKPSDPRIPVGTAAADGVAWLVEGDAAAPPDGYIVRFTLPATSHPAGCSCCAPRGPAAVALAEMFRARATGAAPFFSRVVLLGSADAQAAVESAIATDAMTAARFRFQINPTAEAEDAGSLPQD